MSNGMNDPFLGNLLKDIQKNKKFVDDLMRRELKEVFDESRTTDVRDDLDEDEWHRVLEATMEKMYAKARAMEGQVSGEHGIGFAKKPYLKESLDPAAVAVMQGIKKAFDPNNILNPHKVCFD